MLSADRESSNLLWNFPKFVFSAFPPSCRLFVYPTIAKYPITNPTKKTRTIKSILSTTMYFFRCVRGAFGSSLKMYSSLPCTPIDTRLCLIYLAAWLTMALYGDVEIEE